MWSHLYRLGLIFDRAVRRRVEGIDELEQASWPFQQETVIARCIILCTVLLHLRAYLPSASHSSSFLMSGGTAILNYWCSMKHYSVLIKKEEAH